MYKYRTLYLKLLNTDNNFFKNHLDYELENVLIFVIYLFHFFDAIGV